MTLSILISGTFSGNQTNRFFVSFNDPKDKAYQKVANVTKRSNEDDEDDADGDVDGGDDDSGGESSCSRDSKFHQSVIPQRKKNYHLKRLEKRSGSLKTCSKKCCETDNCILSFLIERSCIGVLCSGDGNCHTRKDDLPKTSFEVAIIKKDGMC